MTNIQVKFTGLAEIQRELRDFSERRYRSVVATALTRTAKALSGEWQQDINTRLDRPTPRTQKAARIESARADKLYARVAIKDAAAGGMAPADYLQQQEFGGGRLRKKFEQALISSGAMPAGYFTVPGEGAVRDGYGNVSRAQIVAVIRQLGTDFSPGYQHVISKSTSKRLQTMAKHGRRYIVIPPGNARISAGVYERQGRALKAIFLFKRSVTYQRRLDLLDTAPAKVNTIAAVEFDRALAASIARLRARGSR